MTTLEQKHIDFLKNEFGINDIDSLSDNMFDEIYEKLCDIEVKEFMNSDNSIRGDIAVEIIDYMADQFDDENIEENKDSTLAV